MATQLSWTGPTTYTDGRPYGAADHGGYEIAINGQSAVAVPMAWNAQNRYTLPLAPLPFITQGNNEATLRTVAANGQASAWTTPITFQYLSTPNAPSALVVG